MSATPSLHFTLLFAGLCGLLQFALTVLVVVRRKQARVSLLDGGDAQLVKRIRAHGNFVEVAPMALLLMALLEWRGFAPLALVCFGVLLVVGRVLHATGILNAQLVWARAVGMGMSLFVVSVQAACCLWVFLRYQIS